MRQAKKRAKAEDRLQKEDRSTAERLSKAHPELNIDVEAYVRQKSAERQPRMPQMPPPLEEPPQRRPRAWEEGGAVEGTYQRQSTIEVEKIEAHLDSLAEREAQASVAQKYKQMFGEDLPIPEGYELIPERRVKRRAGGPVADEAPPEAAPPSEASLQAYGATPPPPELAPLPAPPAPAVPAPAPAPEAPAPAPEPEAAPVAEAAQPAEAAATTEVIVEAPAAPAPEAAPAAAPAPVATAPAAPQVAGVAGAPAAAAAAATAGAVAAKPKEEEPPLKLRKFMDMRRFWKLGPKIGRSGGSVGKLIFGIINVLLYLLLTITTIQIWTTIFYVFKDYKAKKAEEEKRAREWGAQGYGQAEPGAEGYYDEGGYYDYGPEGYEGEPYPEPGYDEYGQPEGQPYAARDYRSDRAGRGGYREEYPDEEGYSY